MVVANLKQYLDRHGVRYVIITHARSITAQETAAAAHVRGESIAKTVMVQLDGMMAMVVLPAPLRLSLPLLKMATAAREVALASEVEFERMFPDCELGAMPPFGNLYDMEVYADEAVTHSPFITFNAGTHTDLIQMSFEDYDRLVQPVIMNLATRHYV